MYTVKSTLLHGLIFASLIAIPLIAWQRGGEDVDDGGGLLPSAIVSPLLGETGSNFEPGGDPSIYPDVFAYSMGDSAPYDPDPWIWEASD